MTDSISTPAQNNELQLTTETHGSKAVIRVSGELDAYRSPELEELGTTLLGSGATEIAIDMANTTFLDSSGLRALLTVRDRAMHAEGRFSISNPSDAVRRLLNITGLDDEIVVTTTDVNSSTPRD